MKTNLLTLLVLHLGLGAVVAQPVITCQPSNQTVIAGSIVTFTVCATGALPLSYQWRSHGSGTTFTNIPFGTEATLVLTNVQPTNRRFAVVVTDAGGLSATSSPLAQLTILPGITQQPVSQSADVGDSVAIRVTATGTTPLSYQWFFNGQSLTGQTHTNIAWTSVQLSNAGNYSVIVTNSVGSITSRVAALTVKPAIFTKITNGPVVNDSGYGFACAWGDYDSDGRIDLFVGNGRNGNFLYHNNGDGTFTPITQGAIVTGNGGLSAAWGDYDNDGFLDLFVCNVNGPNVLYRGAGNGTFEKITNGVLVTQLLQSHAGVWADFNNDGLIDLFVVNFDPAFPNYLYSNKGDGTFDQISFGTKSLTNGASWNVAAADFNNDGWLDIFIPQGGSIVGRQNSLLYTNKQDGTFTLLTNSAVSTNKANGVGCAWGDYDNDGFLDLFVSNFYGQNNFLYHNNGDGTFTSITNSLVTLDGGWSVGCAWADYDNDGWLDLFVANLGPIDLITRDSIAPENNFLYHNNGDGTFAKITTGSLVNDLGYSTGCAWGDYDNDGFLDLFGANGWGTLGEKDLLYRNNGNSNNWINFKLVGTASNRAAIGTKVRVKATVGGNVIWQLRELSGGSNFGSQNDLRANFGLGDATNVETLRIEWPSGTVQELHAVAAKQFLTITEPPCLTATKVNGQPEFILKGGRNMQYDIEASTDLTAWSLIATITITNLNGTAPISDPSFPAAQQKFYRAMAR